MDAIDLRPRVVLQPPGGNVVIDPFGDVGTGSLNVGGLTVPWYIAFGADAVPPESTYLTTHLQTWLIVGLVVAGVVLMGPR